MTRLHLHSQLAATRRCALARRALATFVMATTALVAPSELPAQLATPDKAEIALALDRSSYLGGETARLAILVSVDPGWHINSNTPTFDYLIPTVAKVEAPVGWPPAELAYPPGAMKTFLFEDQPLSVYDGQFVVEARIALPSDVEPGERNLAVALRYQACDDQKCLPPTEARATTTIKVGAPGEAINADSFQPAQPAGGGGPAPAMPLFLLFGVLGGLLLNAMPCVLPVLSLKLLGLVKSSSGGRRSVATGAVATAAGILFSFWALALAAIVAKLGGASVGWGIQFQQPVFVVFLTVVVLLFCLNLWGLFEVPLPARLANWADSTGSEGLAGHFTAGLFATLLATPCSAPFLGTAVGFGLSQSPATIFAIFSAIAVGMALPYLVIAVAPGAVRILPKPGAWMGGFKIFMGFLLAAAAVWLLYVLSSQVSRERLAFIELCLLGLALFVWLRHATPKGAWLATAGILATIAGALVLSAGGGPTVSDATADLEPAPGRLDWVRFDRVEAERLAAAGKLVFVDVTADWCFTCKVNERLALETEEVAAAFERHGVVAMKADWTNRDDSIARFLADHGRYGIPFYLLYRPGREPQLFSEVITKDLIVKAVEAASAKTAA